MNEDDRQLIEAVAKAWIEGGGDYDGFLFCWRDVAGAIADMTASEDA